MKPMLVLFTAGMTLLAGCAPAENDLAAEVPAAAETTEQSVLQGQIEAMKKAEQTSDVLQQADEARRKQLQALD